MTDPVHDALKVYATDVREMMRHMPPNPELALAPLFNTLVKVTLPYRDRRGPDRHPGIHNSLDRQAAKSERHRQAAAVSRKLLLLRAHHLIRKVPRTHRYLLTKAGRIAVTALIAARNANTQELTRLAA